MRWVALIVGKINLLEAITRNNLVLIGALKTACASVRNCKVSPNDVAAFMTLCSSLQAGSCMHSACVLHQRSDHSSLLLILIGTSHWSRGQRTLLLYHVRY